MKPLKSKILFSCSLLTKPEGNGADVRFGFIVLEYYMDGYFENNSNYDNAEDLYHHLLDKWKFCWIVDKAKVNGTEEFEDYERSLTKEQQTERDKALAHFEAAFRQIQTE